MAFCNKLGSLIRQRTLAPTTSFLTSVRYMSTKLFIGGKYIVKPMQLQFGRPAGTLDGLSYGTDDQSLKEAFNNFGNVTEARVITDRETGRSRGFGFVNFDNDEAAQSALSSMDGQELHGRNIRVSYANERPATGFRGGRGGFGGGGGYGGSSGQGDF